MVTLRAMSKWRLVMVALVGTLVLSVPDSATAAPPEPPPPSSTYRVVGLDNPAARTAVARQGIEILSGGPDYLEIVATPEQAAGLRASGLRLIPVAGASAVPVGPGKFPVGYQGYHTQDQLIT